MCILSDLEAAVAPAGSLGLPCASAGLYARCLT